MCCPWCLLSPQGTAALTEVIDWACGGLPIPQCSVVAGVFVVLMLLSS